jgi:LPXTG-site transpeptidase (sortase) family protein
VLGLFALALWSGARIESQIYQMAESGKLDAALLEAESGRLHFAERGAGSAVAKLARHARQDPGPGDVLGRIEIPRLGISAIVAEGVDTKTLSRAVGHLPSTARPGDSGNCALAGHRDTFLRGLGEVREGDIVRIVTAAGSHSYRVEWSEIVEPHRVDVLDATESPSLTLVTCYPFAFVGRAPQRFIVRASRVESDEEDEYEIASPFAHVTPAGTRGHSK